MSVVNCFYMILEMHFMFKDNITLGMRTHDWFMVRVMVEMLVMKVFLEVAETCKIFQVNIDW